MIAVVALFAALLASHLTPSGPAMPHPSVGDWRATYLGSDGRLRTVSATGEIRTGAALPNADLHGLLLSPQAGISADGRYLAYVQMPAGYTGYTSGPVAVVDLASGRVTTLDLMATELHWAPDASRFVSSLSTLDRGTVRLSVTVTDMGANQSHDIPRSPVLDRARAIRLVGWIDAQHVAIIADQGGKEVTVSLLSLDVATGETTPLSTLVEPPDVYLSPDGKLAFIAPNYWAPSARIVDTATGSTRELPNITATFAGRLKHFANVNLVYGGNWAYQWAWRPGTHTIALSLSASSNPNEGETQPETQEAGVWLINLDHDQATNLTPDRYPLAWTPDGRTLFLSDIAAPSMLTNTGYSVGPHLYALSPVTAEGRSQLLAQDMVAFLGLARPG
jgi:sugar lactone lactonase YvrE